MVTAQIRFSAPAGTGGFVEVRSDSSANGPFKNMVYGNFSSGPLTGEFLSDLTGVTIAC